MKEQIHSPAGFQLYTTQCGLKSGDQEDLAVILSDRPCQVKAAFTTNKVKAAPVLYDQKIIQSAKPVRAVVINAGNANACTGEIGMQHTRQMVNAVSSLGSTNPDEVLVLSTGVIGVPLPVDLVLAGIQKISTSRNTQSWLDVAEAIMTTDTHPKVASIRSPEGYAITGVAKGAGMISPNMATMLSVICTDASLSSEMLQKIQDIWDLTFNRIVVDGDMSTNDTVVLLANGASGVELDLESDFLQNFSHICTHLAKSIVKDGEGATKLVTISVQGAQHLADAEKISRAIATSPLCKTAFYGADPNWGRIICAAGYAGATFVPERANLYLKKNGQTILLFEKGQAAPYNEAEAIELMQSESWEISLDLGLGRGDFWLWTCDLSHEYVTINGHYRT